MEERSNGRTLLRPRRALCAILHEENVALRVVGDIDLIHGGFRVAPVFARHALSRAYRYLGVDFQLTGAHHVERTPFLTDLIGLARLLPVRAAAER